jgi:hypothetical protein
MTSALRARIAASAAGRERGRRRLPPLIAVALVSMAGGSWHPVAAYIAGGCLLSVLVACRMKVRQVCQLAHCDCLFDNCAPLATF